MQSQRVGNMYGMQTPELLKHYRKLGDKPSASLDVNITQFDVLELPTNSLCTQHNRSADEPANSGKFVSNHLQYSHYHTINHTTSLATAIPVHTFTQLRQVRYIQPL